MTEPVSSARTNRTIRALATLLCLAMLDACATRGTIDSACLDFNAQEMPKSQLLTDITSDAAELDPLAATRPEAGGRLADDPIRRSMNALLPDGRRSPGWDDPSLLLLSGGGQWGAFGAGFLAALHDQNRLPRFGTITGVSTGGLQSLFLGMLGDPLVTDKGQVLREMMRRYRPAVEMEVVDRDARKEYAIVTGSFAGLKPLRRRIHLALCDDGTAPTECPVIRSLARSSTNVFIGFVQARDGQFYYVHINQLAKRAYPDAGADAPAASPAALAEAQRCIAGAALASAAMPVFFQQVRVGPKGREVTYYDGGVRQSVFEARVIGLLESAIADAARDATSERAKALAAGEGPPIYVVRNGPTSLALEEKANAKGNAIDAAMRAEAIVVNQLEVQSIADLRLAHPRGPIYLVTADGNDRLHEHPGDDPALADAPHFAVAGSEQCRKEPEEAMFSPAFMGCVMRYGRFRAQRTSAWKSLSDLKLAEESR